MSSSAPTPPGPSSPTTAAPMVTDTISSPLMRLPRELRDNIYGRLHREKPIRVGIPHQPTCMGLFVESGPVPPLLRVSRQFSKEYSESVSRCAQLDVRHGMRPNACNKPAVSTTSLRLLKRAIIYCVMTCANCAYHRDPSCIGSSGLEGYLSKLSKLTPHFPFLKRVEIEFDMVVEIPPPNGLEDEKSSGNHDFDQLLAALDRVEKNSGLPISAMKVGFSTYHRDFSLESWYSPFSAVQTHSKWTAAKGWHSGRGELTSRRFY